MHDAVIDWSLKNVFRNNMQSSHLQILCKLRLKYTRNLLIGYLNIKSLRDKITDVREMIGRLHLDYFVISDTKLHSSFPSAQFHIADYEIRNRRNRDKSGCELSLSKRNNNEKA